MKPVLKWVGGKKRLLPIIRELMPKSYNNYYEPFIGGGAVLFDLKPTFAVINDLNSELINVYQMIKEHPDDLIDNLKCYKNEAEFYYEMRSADRSGIYKMMSPILRASRSMYLNKTCFNGIYRVNIKGEFNSSFANYANPVIANEDAIRLVSDYFNKNNITMTSGDFGKSLKQTVKGDFVYFDPPYHPTSDNSGFQSYVKTGFGTNNQIRLKTLCDDLNENGVNFLLSNSDSEFMRDLYKDYNITTTGLTHNLKLWNGNRCKSSELLIRNYKGGAIYDQTEQDI